MKTAAIVGCGGIAGGYDELSRDGGIYSHAGAYRARASRIALVACAEPDEKRRRRFQEFWGIERGYPTLEAMLAGEQADIISVCTPDAAHAAHLGQIVASGRTRIIWAEKPLTTDKADAERVIDGAVRAGIGIRLTNQRRWEPAHQALAASVRGGAIGPVLSINGYYVKGITHIGATMIDTLRFFVGDVRDVQAVEPFATGCLDGDPSLSAVLWFEGGATGMIHGVDGPSYRYSIFEIELAGADGRVRVLNNGDAIEVERPTAFGHYDGFSELKRTERRATEMNRALAYGLDRMLDALDGTGAADVSEAIEGLSDLAVIDAIRTSATAGGTRMAVSSCRRS